MTTNPAVLRIGNCSGFYGDRLSAMHEMLTGGDLDVLTGDYLAELTMLILGKDAMRDPNLGYARTFVTQATDSLAVAADRGVKLVANAGGLNPAALAEQVRALVTRLGLDLSVAHVDGDDLRARSAELGFGAAMTANAYFGGHGIAAALTAGADIVITGRVTDASLVVGPAAWFHGWAPDNYGALAGATVAGHILECGAQATGGNFSGFADLIASGRLNPDLPIGFPLAHIAEDGSSVISKHPGTGGAVTLDTVTAQLFYEIQGPHYLGPDVTTDLRSVRLREVGTDRIAVDPVIGTAPPTQLKVCLNSVGGWRNSVEILLTGLDLPAKAQWIQAQVNRALAANPPATVHWSQIPGTITDSPTEEGASVRLRCTVLDPSPDPVGKPFTAAVVDIALASTPGFTLTAPPAKPAPYGIYRAAYLDRDQVQHVVHLPDGSTVHPVEPPTTAPPAATAATPPEPPTTPATTDTTRAPLGTFLHARSGDKGGDANLGLWVAHDGDPRRADRIIWLQEQITPDAVRALIPEAAALDIEIHPLPDLGGINVLILGLLGAGVSASPRFDPQAKGLGEWVRSRYIDIESRLL